LIVSVCVAAPAVTDEGERLVTVGTGFTAGCGAEEPPPQPTSVIKEVRAMDRIET
jgi:hypothetical protein